MFFTTLFGNAKVDGCDHFCHDQNILQSQVVFMFLLGIPYSDFRLPGGGDKTDE
jgi:hypothetical protein